MRRPRRRGQTTTEYLLVVSVIVLTLIWALWDPMAQSLTSGSKDFRDNMSSAAEAGAVGQAGGDTSPR